MTGSNFPSKKLKTFLPLRMSSPVVAVSCRVAK
jgi:hypothetical protein